jgi:hypothetical protein
MFDNHSLDVTPVNNDLHTQAMAANIATPVARRDPPRGRTETATITIASPFSENVFSHTLTGAEVRQGSRQAGLAQVPQKEGAEDTARRARVALLVKKHEGKTTREDGARLDILTERIRKMDPRVTARQLDSMAGMIGDLESVSNSLDAIRAKYALR